MFGKAAEFDGAFTGARDFVNGFGDGRVGDKRFVGGVEEDDGPVLPGVIDPRLEFFACCGGSSWVIGGAEIDEVEGCLFTGRNVRHKTISLGARQVVDAFVGAGAVGVAGIAGHDVGIDIDWIHGVRNAEPVALAENIEDVASVAFGAVRDKNLVSRHV